MAIYQWTNGDGNGEFGDQYNWIDPTTTPPTYAVPGPNDAAIINTTGAISGSADPLVLDANVAQLVLDGDGGLLTIDGLGVQTQVVKLAGLIALTNFSELYTTQEMEVVNGSTTVNQSGLNIDQSTTGCGFCNSSHSPARP